eukprot:TRINITY_DN88662_c0_g1_i1.p1 TRINITY_DN88662_c0_g1~~TRINITY_DN88662_c0_g1_i1.p1  ORF type:complete len:333 (-),score=65.47 TRINITY_DN88662_c0_g1_i1:30-1001(-)
MAQLRAQVLEQLSARRTVAQEGGLCLNATCVVCQEPLCSDDWTRSMPCGHAQWHEECLLRWLEERRSCPICRARLQGFEEGDDIGFHDIEGLDLMQLREMRGALQERMAGFEEERHVLEVRLQSVRRWLDNRLVELELERQGLELQVRRLGVELATFGMRLTQLHVERLALWSTLQHSEPASEGHDSTTALSKQPENSCGSFFAEEKPPEEPEKLQGCEDVQVRAEDMLERLRAAVLRTPMPASEVFHVLAAGHGRLNRKAAERVFQALEAAVPSSELSRAFVIMDVDGSGFVEESDWMSALQLPRLSSTRVFPFPLRHSVCI